MATVTKDAISGIPGFSSGRISGQSVQASCHESVRRTEPYRPFSPIVEYNASRHGIYVRLHDANASDPPPPSLSPTHTPCKDPRSFATMNTKSSMRDIWKVSKAGTALGVVYIHASPPSQKAKVAR